MAATSPVQVQNWSTAPPEVQPHEETAEIIRQVEYYFSDENLPHDAHLLALTGGDGNGAVSCGHILSFKKMRQYKPRSRVIASLKQSTQIELTGNDKLMKRRSPLTKAITAIPKIRDAHVHSELAAKPWLTKGMLKPTGFEDYATDGPIRPEEYAIERKLFDPEEAFHQRIEHAVVRYQSKRKMHQLTLQVFTKFLMFCGFDAGPRQFSGGITSADVEEMDKDHIDQVKANFALSDMVLDGLDEDRDGGPSWVVDFETTAKAFLSSSFLQHFDWSDTETVAKGVNVLRNFYNYLLYHDVCPEYVSQIHAARRVCDMAEKELPKLVQADRHLPGNFSIACSVLHAGSYAGDYRAATAAWNQDVHATQTGLSDADAWLTLAAALTAHGSDAQVAHAETVRAQGTYFRVISTKSVGLEVQSIERASPSAREIYEGTHSPLAGTKIRTTGKLHCIPWRVPHASPEDLPADVVAAREAALHTDTFTFFVEEDVLEYCYPGLKMEATVCELDVGVQWLDVVETVYPSFFTWTLNEVVREWKEPGPPKGWMVRQMGKQEGEGEGEEGPD